MKLTRLDPKGIQFAEIEGVRALEAVTRGAAFCKDWFGFTNLVMRKPGPGGERREIDIVIVTHDRIIIADLKHWRGKTENQGGFWIQNGKSRGRSASLKIEDNARTLAEVIRSEATGLAAPPWVDHFVIFTEATPDITGLSPNDLSNTMLLRDFKELLTDSRKYRTRFQPFSTWTLANPLFGATPKHALSRFFLDGKQFIARETVFGEYQAEGAPIYEHTVWKEYFCVKRADSNYTALLRLWDCSALDTTFSALQPRRELLDREHSVLGFINKRAPQYYDEGVLHPIARDEEFTLRYWDLFALRRSMRRLFEYVRQKSEIGFEGRADLAVLLLSRAAELHRMEVAHRDIGHHSIWYEPETFKLVLSAFGAARFPEHASLADNRLALLAAGDKLPEDAGYSSPSTAFQQDVYLLGAACWQVLVGAEPSRIDGCAVFDEAAFRAAKLPPALGDWFQGALQADPRKRFPTAIEMQDAFETAVGRRVATGVTDSLAEYRNEANVYFKYPVTEPLRQGRAQVWRSGTGDNAVVVKLWPEGTGGSKVASRMLSLLSLATELRKERPAWLPETIDVGWSPVAGVHLVQRHVNAPNLAAYDRSTLSVESATAFLVSLIASVQALHDMNMAHGDLKPDNILVVGGERGPSAMIVDFPELHRQDGEISTAAYSPPDGNADSATRDRYAVCQIVRELLAPLGADPKGKDLAGRLVGASIKCGTADPPWASLTLLIAEINRPPVVIEEHPDVMVGIRDTRGQDLILPDNGEFHVVADAFRREIHLVGLDQQLTVRFAPDKIVPVESRVVDASPATLGWAISQRVLAFKGRLEIYQASAPAETDLAWLLEQRPVLDVLSGAPTPSAEPEEAIDVADESVEPVARAKRRGDEAARPTPNAARLTVGLSKLWRGVIDAEEELLPWVEVFEAPMYDELERIHYVACREGPVPTDFGREQSVRVLHKGKNVATLDRGLTTPRRLALRSLRRGTNIQVGARLSLLSNDDHASYQRRRDAVARIVEQKSVIPQLIDYLDPRTNMKPQAMSTEPPPREDIAAYELNDGQRKAFERLWTSGPVGLLQGPPGTGKTRFIASFVHWALTRGGLGNALILSQGHEAANKAVEEVLKIARKLGDNLDLLRVGQRDKVSEALLPFHSDAVQDRYRELFRAEMKSRVALAGKNLGLPPEYVAEAFELEATLGSLVRRIGLREEEAVKEEDREIAQRRLRTLRSAANSMLNKLAPGEAIELEFALDVLGARLAERHHVRSADAIDRLMQAIRLSEEWVNVLATRDRNLEEFLARSRSIVCGTCVGIGRPALNISQQKFDLVVIDEAARCDPGELAVGAQSGRRVLLVGDHKQLPPLYDLKLVQLVAQRLKQEDEDVIKVSDFERAFLSPYGKEVGCALYVQYRMAPDISRVVSECFYPEVGLKPGRGAPPEHYEKLPRPLDHELLWLDTSVFEKAAHDDRKGTSRVNRKEAEVVLSMLRLLSKQQEFWEAVRAEKDYDEEEPSIGVIAMYAAQRDLIDSMFAASEWPPGFAKLVKIETVDSYQGHENRIVVVSLVRNNTDYKAGHVKELQRANVALSRAKERLIVVGSLKMFEGDWEGNSLAPVVKRFKEVPGQDSRILDPRNIGQGG